MSIPYAEDSISKLQGMWWIHCVFFPTEQWFLSWDPWTHRNVCLILWGDVWVWEACTERQNPNSMVCPSPPSLYSSCLKTSSFLNIFHFLLPWKYFESIPSATIICLWWFLEKALVGLYKNYGTIFSCPHFHWSGSYTTEVASRLSPVAQNNTVFSLD